MNPPAAAGGEETGAAGGGCRGAEGGGEAAGAAGVPEEPGLAAAEESLEEKLRNLTFRKQVSYRWVPPARARGGSRSPQAADLRLCPKAERGSVALQRVERAVPRLPSGTELLRESEIGCIKAIEPSLFFAVPNENVTAGVRKPFSAAPEGALRESHPCGRDTRGGRALHPVPLRGCAPRAGIRCAVSSGIVLLS